MDLDSALMELPQNTRDHLLYDINLKFNKEACKGFSLKSLTSYIGHGENDIMNKSQQFLSYLIGKKFKYDTELVSIIIINELLDFIDNNMEVI